MAKDPAFLFYSADFLIGTCLLSNEETGKYIKILCLLHQHGSVKIEVIENIIGKLSVTLMDKFRLTEDGYLVNDRLTEEIEKRKKFTESRRINGRMAGKKPIGKAIGKPIGKTKTNLPENENINDNINDNDFNTMPISKNFNGLPEIKKGAAKEFVRITKKVNISDNDIDDIWEVFKIQNLTGKKYYPDEESVYSHFLNWIKTQNFDAATKNKKDGKQISHGAKNDGAYELLDSIKKDFGIDG